jgi:hypothetical protein
MPRQCNRKGGLTKLKCVVWETGGPMWERHRCSGEEAVCCGRAVRHQGSAESKRGDHLSVSIGTNIAASSFSSRAWGHSVLREGDRATGQAWRACRMAVHRRERGGEIEGVKPGLVGDKEKQEGGIRRGRVCHPWSWWL